MIGALVLWAALGAQPTEVALLKFADRSDEPCTPAEAGDIVYGQYGSWLLAESRGKEWLTGSRVTGWLTLPQPQSYYCTITLSDGTMTGCNQQKLFDDALATVKPYFDPRQQKLVVYVYNNWGGGAWTGSPFINVGCTPGHVTLTRPIISHEGGHAQQERLYHAAAAVCDVGDTFPNLDDPAADEPGGAGACFWGSYSDSYDPMGGAGMRPDQHYSTYMRGRLNWQSNIEQIATARKFTLRRADVESVEPQEARVWLKAESRGDPAFVADYYYTLEYRPEWGGVMIRYEGCWDCPGAETFQVNRYLPITMIDPFIDTYRGIRISMLSSDPDYATLEVAYDNPWSLCWTASPCVVDHYNVGVIFTRTMGSTWATWTESIYDGRLCWEVGNEPTPDTVYYWHEVEAMDANNVKLPVNCQVGLPTVEAP